MPIIVTSYSIVWLDNNYKTQRREFTNKILIGEISKMNNNREIIIRKIPNLITALRIVLTIVTIWICYEEITNFYSVLSITGIIFLTDILDGKLARKLNAETKAGEIMDVFADMGYIFAISVIMSSMNIISESFIILVSTEFIVFISTSKFLKDSNRFLFFDVAGRALAVVYYITPIIMYVLFYKAPGVHSVLYKYGFMTLVFFTFVVVIYRMSLCRVNIKQIIGAKEKKRKALVDSRVTSYYNDFE